MVSGGVEEVRLQCPYCWERFETLADCSAGSQEYVEDCAVCCQPILVQLQVDAEGTLLGVEARRENE